MYSHHHHPHPHNDQKVDNFKIITKNNLNLLNAYRMSDTMLSSFLQAETLAIKILKKCYQTHDQTAITLSTLREL